METLLLISHIIKENIIAVGHTPPIDAKVVSKFLRNSQGKFGISAIYNSPTQAVDHGKRLLIATKILASELIPPRR